MTQVNLDFENEADMVEKMRIGIALQPLATALFANSPFRDGKDTGETGRATRATALADTATMTAVRSKVTACFDRVQGFKR